MSQLVDRAVGRPPPSDAVADQFARLVACGRIVLREAPMPAYPLCDPYAESAVGLVDLGQPQPSPVEPLRSATFIHFEVIHASGASFEGAGFDLTAPDGREVADTLGPDSLVQIDDVRERGSATVCFGAGALQLQRTAQTDTPVTPRAGDIRVPLGATAPIALRTGIRHRIVVEYAEADVLEVQDVCFGHDRAVLLPCERPEPAGEAGLRVTDGVLLVARALEFAAENPAKSLLVVGHADASGAAAYNQALSEARARSAVHLLRGEHERWGAHTHEHHAVDDLQVLLAWAARVRPAFGCDPGSVDGVFGPRTAQGLRRLREGANEADHAGLALDGPARAKDFTVIARLVDEAVAARLGESIERLASIRARLRTTPPEACGLGEAYARVHDQASRAERAHDRRVDVVFLDPGEARLLHDADIGEALYGPTALFRQRALDPWPPGTTVRLLLGANEPDGPFASDRPEAYQLRSADGSFELRRPAVDAVRVSPHHFALEFADVPKRGRYTLSCDPHGRDAFEVVVLEELTHGELVDACAEGNRCVEVPPPAGPSPLPPDDDDPYPVPPSEEDDLEPLPGGGS